MSEQPREQLHMLWPETRRDAPAVLSDSDPDYRLRTYRPTDAEAYLALLAGAGFTWDAETLAAWLDRALPDGLFLIEHRATGQLAATAMASHNPSPLHPFGGELGWVAGSPAHAGRGLGRAVCAAVIARFLSAGYRRIYLKTDDWRLPALSIYLRLGITPFLYTPDMRGRWQSICEQVRQPFTPEAWPGPVHIPPLQVL
jgi:mycothiol synthase